MGRTMLNVMGARKRLFRWVYRFPALLTAPDRLLPPLAASYRLESQHVLRVLVPHEHAPVGAARLGRVVRVHEDVVAEAGEIHEAVFAHLAARVLPQIERHRDARSAPAECDVGWAVLEVDPSAVGAPSGNVARPALTKLSVDHGDPRVERFFRLILRRPRGRVALRPKVPQEVPLAGERQRGINAPLVRLHEVQQWAVQAVELDL